MRVTELSWNPTIFFLRSLFGSTAVVSELKHQLTSHTRTPLVLKLVLELVLEL
jgi:hypothetical protein